MNRQRSVEHRGHQILASLLSLAALADVTQVAKLWRKAAGQLSAESAEAFTKTMAQIRDAQDKVTTACG